MQIAEQPPTIDAIFARAALLKAEVARRSNLAFTVYTKPDYEVNWHHEQVAEALDRVVERKCRRLMIFEPPQNGKSEQVSRRFPAFVLGKRPSTKLIACSYSMSLAQDMSRDVQKIMNTREYQTLFPKVRLGESRDVEKRTQGQFEIVGHTGYYIAAGVDGPITGKTAHIGLIDDPIKNRAEAESEVYRERVWDWYKSAFMTRQFGSDGAIIICLTRWHEDDLAGRLLNLAKNNAGADQWEVISLPAIRESIEVRMLPKENAEDPDRVAPKQDLRNIGEALWPEKYPLAELKRRRIGMGEYDWAALYQQTPAPAGGGLFKREWFKFVDAAPAVARRVRGWDTAGTENGGDYTVGVKIAEPPKKVIDPETSKETFEPSGLYYIESVVRAQLGPAGVDSLIKATADLDGPDCAQREEKEGGSSGLAVIAARTKTLAGKDYAGVSITGNKVTRAKPFRAQCEAGNVFIVRDGGVGGVNGTGWNEDYINELCGFPTAKHDDHVDGSSCAYNAILLEPLPGNEFVSW